MSPVFAGNQNHLLEEVKGHLMIPSPVRGPGYYRCRTCDSFAHTGGAGPAFRIPCKTK